MAKHSASIKDIRRTKKANARNRAGRTTMRTAIGNALGNKNKESSEQILRAAVSAIDKGVKRGLIHRNNGARKKARLYRVAMRLGK